MFEKSSYSEYIHGHEHWPWPGVSRHQSCTSEKYLLMVCDGFGQSVVWIGLTKEMLVFIASSVEIYLLYNILSNQSVET